MQNHEEEEEMLNLAYERGEDYTDIEYKIVECPECNGDGSIRESHCCGDDVIDSICQNVKCLKECEYEIETCKKCTGDGEIEIEWQTTR
jgi:DnaJ-class molecular chaperone